MDKYSHLTKVCKSCSREFPATNEHFHKQLKGKYGFTSKCKSCKNTQIENWRLKNLETHRQYKIKWRTENRKKYLELKRRDTNRRRSSNHVPYTEEDVLKLHGSNCHLCNLPIDMNAPRSCNQAGWEFGLHIDHVIQICMGGEDTIYNVKPAHGICNIKKNKRS